MAEKEYTVEAVNTRLKEAIVRVRLKQKGNAIALVATLPPKPGSNRPRPYQQEIFLGIPASVEGLERAEREAIYSLLG